MAMLNRWMDGRREKGGREVWLFFGCSVRGIVNSKIPYPSFTGEVSIGEKRAFFPPCCYAMPSSWL